MIDKPNILIVEARFYSHIADALLDGATAVLDKAGAHFERLAVPGALEIPTAIALAARAGEHGGQGFDGFIALGCVILGARFDRSWRQSRALHRQRHSDCRG